MGASASKTAGKAAAAAGCRQYPSTSSILNSATSTSNAPSHTTTPPNPTPSSSSPSSPPPPTSIPSGFQPSQVHPDPATAPPSTSKPPNSHIDLDGRDPQFASSLRALGPAVEISRPPPSAQTAFPTSSNPPPAQQSSNNQPIFPSTNPQSNSSLLIVQARTRISEKYDSESENLGRGSFAGRTLLGAKEISEAIRMRDERGVESGKVERNLRLKGGILDVLGPRGMVGNASA